MRDVALGEIEIAQGFAKQDFGGDAAIGMPQTLETSAPCARRAIGFQHVHRVVTDRVLNVIRPITPISRAMVRV